MIKKAKGPKKQPTGDYAVGYCRPPVHSRTKPGQVLNPHGRNGKAVWEPDAFDKVRLRLSRVTLDGEMSMLPSDEAYWLKQMSRAMAGDKTAAKIIAQELGARRRLGPPPPTAEELAQQEAEEAERRRYTEQICDALDLMADMKRRKGPPNVRYGPDGRPIDTIKRDPSSGPLD